MVKCEEFYEKFEQLERMAKEVKGYCKVDAKRSIERFSKYNTFCEIHDLRPIGRIPEGALRPLMSKRNEDIASIIVKQLKKRMKSDNPNFSKITNKLVKEKIKEIRRRQQAISEYQQMINDFLNEHPMLFTTLFYKERGPFGDSSFRGNASGWLLVELINLFKPGYVYDPMEGSGTSRDVCKTMGVLYEGNDILNEDGWDLLDPSYLTPLNDLTYFHPPYWDIIPYSYKANDLSQASSWNEYENLLKKCIDKLLAKTKILAILIADIYKGSDKQFHTALPMILGSYKERLIRILIKFQRKEQGYFSVGAEREPLAIRHEYVILLKGNL